LSSFLVPRTSFLMHVKNPIASQRMGFCVYGR